MKGRRCILTQRASTGAGCALYRISEFRDIQAAGEYRSGPKKYSEE